MIELIVEKKTLDLIKRYYQDEYGRVVSSKISIDDVITNLINDGRVASQVSLLNRFIGLNKSMKILDMGSGIGDLVLFLNKEGYQARGYEVDKRLFEISSQRDNSTNKDSFLYAENGLLPVPDNTFDVVFSNFVLEHVHDVGKYIQECIRVLKPGGQLCIITCNYTLGYEYHYSMPLPLFSRYLSKLFLKILGRDDKFLDGITFITPLFLDRLFKKIQLNLHASYRDESIKFFYSELFNEDYHSKLFIKLAHIAKLSGLLKILVRLGLYNPIIIVITKNPVS